MNIYKAQFVMKGHAQMYNVDYGETFTPMNNVRTIGTILALIVVKG